MIINLYTLLYIVNLDEEGYNNLGCSHSYFFRNTIVPSNMECSNVIHELVLAEL